MTLFVLKVPLNLNLPTMYAHMSSKLFTDDFFIVCEFYQPCIS